MAKINLREQMPLVTEFIDACREAFGVDQINASIKSGMEGQPNFFACEAGHSVGTRAIDRGVPLSQMHVGPAPTPSPVIGDRK